MQRETHWALLLSVFCMTEWLEMSVSILGQTDKTKQIKNRKPRQRTEESLRYGRLSMAPKHPWISGRQLSKIAWSPQSSTYGAGQQWHMYFSVFWCYHNKLTHV